MKATTRFSQRVWVGEISKSMEPAPRAVKRLFDFIRTRRKSLQGEGGALTPVVVLKHHARLTKRRTAHAHADSPRRLAARGLQPLAARPGGPGHVPGLRGLWA